MASIENEPDDGGRLALGNAGGSGNPNARTAHKWRERLAGSVTDADFEAIIRRMAADAIADDKDALNRPLDRPCGKAGSVREDDNSDEHNLLFIRRPISATPRPGAIPTATGDDAHDG